MDRLFFVQTLNDNGVAADIDAFMRADLIARREISRLMRSEDPGTDSSRWQAYARMLMRELKCEGAALEAVRNATRARHLAGDLWTYVEEGTVETLDLLTRSGYKLGVVSNADGRVATFLEKAGLTKYFEVIVDSGVFGIEKPDPRIFIHACELLGIRAQGTIYVGDVYEVDALGARAAGLLPIIVSPAAQADWECRVIRSLTELPALLDADLTPAVR